MYYLSSSIDLSMSRAEREKEKESNTFCSSFCLISLIDQDIVRTTFNLFISHSAFILHLLMFTKCEHLCIPCFLSEHLDASAAPKVTSNALPLSLRTLFGPEVM